MYNTLDEYGQGDQIVSQELRTRGDFVFSERGLHQIEKELSWSTQLGLVTSLQTQENMWNAMELLLKLGIEISYTESVNPKIRKAIKESYNILDAGYFGTKFYSVPDMGSFPQVDDKDFVPLYSLYPFKEQQPLSEALHRVEIAGFCDLSGTLIGSIPFQTWKYYRRKAEKVICNPEAKLKSLIKTVISNRVEDRIKAMEIDIKLSQKVLEMYAEKIICVDRIQLNDLKMVGEKDLKQGDITIPYLSNKKNVMQNRTRFQDTDNPKVFKFGANFFVNLASLVSFALNAPSHMRFDRLNDILGFLFEGIISFWGDTQNKGKKENRKNILRISLHKIVVQEKNPSIGQDEIILDISQAFSTILALWKNLRSASSVKARWTDLEFWDLRRYEHICYNILSYSYGKLFAVMNKILIRDPYLKGVGTDSKSPWDVYESNIPEGFAYVNGKDEEQQE